MHKIIAEELARDIARRELQKARERREQRMLDALFDRGDSSDDSEPVWIS